VFVTATEAATRASVNHRLIAEHTERRIVESAIDQAADRIAAAFRRPTN
jgi:hypothetical protein